MNVLLGCAAALMLTSAVLADDPGVTFQFTNTKVVPDVIDQAPESGMSVIYDDGSRANYGNRFSLSTTASAPRVDYESDFIKYYTLIFLLVGGNVANAACPPNSQYLLWHINNISGNDVDDSGDALAEYMGPFGPPLLSTGDRCVFLVFKQSRRIDNPLLGSVTGNLVRTCFNTRTFMRNNNFTRADAGNFFISTGQP